jgi:phytochrome A
MAEFVLQDVVMAAVSQVLLACQGKGIRVSCNMPEIFMKQLVYGDGVRLQQVLSDVLFVSAKFSPVGGSVGISSKLTKKSIRGNLHLIDLEIRYIDRSSSICMHRPINYFLTRKTKSMNAQWSFFDGNA